MPIRIVSFKDEKNIKMFYTLYSESRVPKMMWCIKELAMR